MFVKVKLVDTTSCQITNLIDGCPILRSFLVEVEGGEVGGVGGREEWVVIWSPSAFVCDWLCSSLLLKGKGGIIISVLLIEDSIFKSFS